MTPGWLDLSGGGVIAVPIGSPAAVDEPWASKQARASRRAAGEIAIDLRVRAPHRTDPRTHRELVTDVASSRTMVATMSYGIPTLGLFVALSTAAAHSPCLTFPYRASDGCPLGSTRAGACRHSDFTKASPTRYQFLSRCPVTRLHERPSSYGWRMGDTCSRRLVMFGPSVFLGNHHLPRGKRGCEIDRAWRRPGLGVAHNHRRWTPRPGWFGSMTTHTHGATRRMQCATRAGGRWGRSARPITCSRCALAADCSDRDPGGGLRRRGAAVRAAQRAGSADAWRAWRSRRPRWTIARDRVGDRPRGALRRRAPAARPTAQYGLGILSHVLEHVPDPPALLAEAARACGAVVMEVPLESNLSARRASKREHAEEVGHLQRLDRARGTGDRRARGPAGGGRAGGPAAAARCTCSSRAARSPARGAGRSGRCARACIA